MAARRTRKGRTRSRAEREFVSEAEEIVERMRDDLLSLSEQQAAGADPDPDLVNQLFRAAHSLKGLSGMFGLDGMSELAHRLEDVLDRLRLGRVADPTGASALVEEAVALVASSLAGLGDDASTAATVGAISDLTGRIDAWLVLPTEAAGDAPDLAIDPTLLRALTEYEEHRLRHNVARGRYVHQIETCHDLQSFDAALSELGEAIKVDGELISTLPSAAGGDGSEIRFLLLAASDLDAPDLAAHLGLPESAVRCTGRSGDAAGEPAPAAGAAAPAVPAAEPAAAGRAPGDEVETLKSIGETVRVDIRKLDELMNLVGELMIQRRTLGALAQRLLADDQTTRVGAELDKVHKGLERKLQELQAGVLEVRMVPLRQIFEKLSRVVRRLRRDLDRAVKLEIRGADTELDKLIVEELVDPLVHVVRNAFDHAIEPPAEREAAGKPVEGTIRIEAYQRGNDVIVAVSDDGRGIDSERVHRKALERELVDPEQNLSPKEKLDLVFTPGLSTRDEVTETSGRGVGMDVVRANVTALGGLVGIESTPGQGTCLTMTLPITLAIVQALVVSVGAQRFAVPLSAVHETLFVAEEDLQRSRGGELLNLRGQALPVRRLAREFALPQTDPPDKMSLVVLGLGELRVGLLVDRLEGQQDAVIKPIQGPVADLRGIAGATELGDGEAVLVLDVAALVEDAGRLREAA